MQEQEVLLQQQWGCLCCVVLCHAPGVYRCGAVCTHVCDSCIAVSGGIVGDLLKVLSTAALGGLGSFLSSF